jgi:hypothetical protein
MLNELLTPEQIAAMIGRNPLTVRCWFHRAKLGRKIGGRWFCSKEELASFLGIAVEKLAP